MESEFARGRALEVLLGCDDFSAEMAERYGATESDATPAIFFVKAGSSTENLSSGVVVVKSAKDQL